MNEDCPCNGCVPPKRKRACHGSCPEYKTWDSEKREKKAEYMKMVREEKIITEYAIRTTRRIRGRKLEQEGLGKK
jgi:hypothetical protein